MTRMIVFYWSVLRHKWAVARGLLRLAGALTWRAVTHDLSKFRRDEARGFASHLPQLSRTRYDQDGKYDKMLEQDGLAGAVKLHYDRNRHHPQHFDRGVRAMTLVDVAEMLSDWAAACGRSPGGTLAQSLNINRSRFSLDYAVLLLIENTARNFFAEEYDGPGQGEQPTKPA